VKVETIVEVAARKTLSRNEHERKVECVVTVNHDA